VLFRSDKVTVVSRRAGVEANQAVCWESGGEGDYTVEMVEKATRGTDVTLHLRDGEDEFLSGWKLKSIIRKYSDHITLPIVMEKEEWNQEKGEQVATGEDETVNQANALWVRSKSDITDEQCTSPTTSKTRWRGPMPASKASRNTPNCSTSRPAPRLICGTVTPATASSSTSAASSSWTTPNS